MSRDIQGGTPATPSADLLLPPQPQSLLLRSLGRSRTLQVAADAENAGLMVEVGPTSTPWGDGMESPSWPPCSPSFPPTPWTE